MKVLQNKASVCQVGHCLRFKKHSVFHVFSHSILLGGKTKDDASRMKNLYKRLISDS